MRANFNQSAQILTVRYNYRKSLIPLVGSEKISFSRKTSSCYKSTNCKIQEQPNTGSLAKNLRSISMQGLESPMSISNVTGINLPGADDETRSLVQSVSQQQLSTFPEQHQENAGILQTFFRKWANWSSSSYNIKRTIQRGELLKSMPAIKVY